MSAACVRVEPPCVTFRDVRVGQVYRTTVTVTNAGKTSNKIVFQKPATTFFRFTVSSPAVVVAPGLSVSGVLEFTPEEEEEVRDGLLVHVNGEHTLKIPLMGIPRTCSLLMDSEVDFGCIAASGQLVSKHHPIINRGSAPGVFQVQYSGESSLSISPCSGVVAPGATQWLKLKLCADRPRHIFDQAEVKLQNRSAVVLTVKADVMDQHLEIFDLQGDPLSCLWLGPVYFGTSCVENVVLRNSSPKACDWLCVIQSSAAGTEVGTDLQRSTDAALLEKMKNCSPASHDVSQVLACVPKQGKLGPFGKTTVAVRFSPVSKSVTREKKRGSLPSRQDYCLFLLFESVGSKHGFTHHHANSNAELAVTGSGLPVSLVPSPSGRFDFLSCVTGQHVDLLCVLQNLCPQLPVSFSFRKVAHFSTEPSSGTIGPGQSQDVVLSFNARQQGSFQVHQKLDVLGYVVCKKDDGTAEDVAELERCSFHMVTLHFSAVCHMSSSVTSPLHVKRSELAHCRQIVRTAVLSADKTRLHKHRREKSADTEEEEFLAFPNDRASSIRPASPNTLYRTIFTGLPRYRYVDTDYALTEDEEEQRQRDRQVYADFTKQLRQTRLQRIKEKQQERLMQDVDIGIVPAQGLVPPSLRITDLTDSEVSESDKPNTASVTRQVTNTGSAVMNAVPSTNQEVADCNRTLTAQELYQVVIGPLSVDFGEVCVKSVCVQNLELVNNLSAHVWIQLEVDFPELQGSSPLSHVLPPHSHSALPLTFLSNKLGPFYGLVSFSVNQQHPGQILVQAQVVPLALDLSTNLLVIQPSPSLLAASGYRSSVTLRNQLNRAAEFTWRPVVTESGILFSVRPATGVVEAGEELDCEVVWEPSFTSPSEGDFDLCVHEGNTQRLHCVAKVGATSVQLAEKWVMFRSVPLNMPSTRTAVLQNTGQNHAYYQVLDMCPMSGMLVSPSKGTVPSRGQAVLKINFIPECVVKFDATVEIALRNMKSIEMRVGGSVEPPNVDISVDHFHFYGVYAGSQSVAPFVLTNRSSAVACVTFDLSEHDEFSVGLPQPSAKRLPGVSVVELQGFQTLDYSLVFSPDQMASYDFVLPIMVNGVRWPYTLTSLSTTVTSSSISSSGSRKHTAIPLSHTVTMATQQCPHVQATVLCAPLEISPSRLQFEVEPQSDTPTQKVELKAACEGSVCWRACTGGRVRWWFDCSVIAAPAENRIERALCMVSPSSGSLGPGRSVCLMVSIKPEAIGAGSERVIQLSLPLYLGDTRGEEMGVDEGREPYRELSITITLQVPTITIHPPIILLQPVPLRTNAEATLTLLTDGYPRGTSVSVEVDEVKLEDGKEIQPVSIIFPEGNTIPAEDLHQETSARSLMCTVEFSSAVPLSLCTTITFSDHLHNRFQVQLYAITENCLLTVWPYVAVNYSEQQIVLKTGATAVEAILQRYHTPSPASGPTSSSASSFDHNSSANKNSDSFPDSDSVTASRDTDSSAHRESSSTLGVPEFPAADTEEGLYYQNVLFAVEKWFSFFGWPGGMHPITVPHTLRSVYTNTDADQSSGQAHRVSQNKNQRSVFDMLQHLTGRQIPGIPRCQTLSADIEQRTNRLLQWHKAVLDFLRVQGASLCHIRPQYLLDVLEFKHWCSQQSNNTKQSLNYDYESLSKRSWTDVLLQIFKVLVLCRVSEKDVKTPLDHVHSDEVLTATSASNIYSPRELQLLSWLNVHYHSMREKVRGTGGVPSARWIVNFDLDLADGLVLAALLAAYCPYLITSHFRRMYSSPSSLEQILHNNIIVARALTTLGLNINIQPTDLSDPNPVQMLILCVHLYEKLPRYVPVHTITLSGGLHSTFSKQVRVKNPSSQSVRYKALLFGEDAPLFSLPDGSTITIPPKSSKVVTVNFNCSFLQPMEAVLVLISSPVFGLCCATLTFALKTHITHITPTETVECESPCYQLEVIQVPLTNMFYEEAKFRVVLVESGSNPLEPETTTQSLFDQASSRVEYETHDSLAAMEKMPSHQICVEQTEDSEGSEFLSAVRDVYLKPGQTATLRIHYLPFCPGTKHCSVLLVSLVGDMVYMVKTTSQLPLPSPLTAKPSAHIESIPQDSATAVCVSVLRLQCTVGQLCEEVLRVPRINMQWEQALAVWAQHCMSIDERRRRLLTHTMHSSTVRATTAAQKLCRQLGEELEYSVEVSLPQYFTLPCTVTIPLKEDTDIPWENPADCGCVDIPLQFQADAVGKYECKLALRSWCDTRVYSLEAMVTSQEESIHLDFTSPAHRSVTQLVPLHNETQQDWKIQAGLCGEGFSGPSVLSVPAGTRVCYPLTFHPAAQHTVTGLLSLQNNCNGTKHVFSLRGVGERPLPVDHVLIHCPVGKTTHTQLDVPNYSQNKRSLKVVTDLSVVTGLPCLEIEPGRTAPYTLSVLPWKRGKQTGCVSFVESGAMQEVNESQGNASACYEVHFSLEIICEPAAPIKVIDVQCVSMSSVAIEIPVNNPGGELLTLDVCVEGGSLSGAVQVSVPPRATLIYKASFSPWRVGKCTGSVLFQSEAVGEFWYQLQLYALPPPVITEPQTCCQLGKWTRLNIPLVNPTAETLQLTVRNSNPRNYTLEMDSGGTVTVEPQSSSQLGVRFSPSAIGEGNHKAKITFTCPQLQEWCVLLSGRGLTPQSEVPLSVSSAIGSTASITIPFTNPTELPATLSVTLTDEDPSGAPSSSPVRGGGVFSVPLSHTEGVLISEGDTLDVPVVFAPKSVELQQAWLCISMKPIRRLDNGMRSESERSTICWTYPLCGIPAAVAAEDSELGVLRCEAGCQLVKKVDVRLTECVPGNEDRRGQGVVMEDFQCEVLSDGEGERREAEDCLSASVGAVRRDPENGIITLSLNLVYTPLRACRSLAIVAVHSVSGKIWKFTISLVATQPQVDDVILMETTKLGQTSAVGFRLTSTTRRSERFAAALLPGSSSEFTVTPLSGTLPPAGSTGALITVSFTPTAACNRHRATLSIQAADMRWTYEVKGKSREDSPPL